MNFEQFNFDDLGTSLLSGNKRDREENGTSEADIFENTAKKISIDYDDANFQSLMAAPIAVPPPLAKDTIEQQPKLLSCRNVPPEPRPEPFPYYFYRDHSTETDPDPLTPLTLPGRVPNFPAKMHSILYREELKDIIAWMPHGRAWRVLKPREFETRVIPTYFEHAKFSSFIRQANGWGFRRITQGRDRNAYYHPLFLRALPHLCKTMKRPGVAEKQASDPDFEPDLYKISEMHPIPERSNDDSILLECTLKGGPKARMPIYTTPGVSQGPPSQMMLTRDPPPKLTPNDQLSLHAFRESLGASESQLKNHSQTQLDSTLPPRTQNPRDVPPAMMPQTNMMPTPMNSLPLNMPVTDSGVSPLALANQLAFAAPNMPGGASNGCALNSITTNQNNNGTSSQSNGRKSDNTTSQQNMAAAQFAAGFAAATALSHQQFQAMMAQLGAGMFMQQGNNNNQSNNSNNNDSMNPMGQAAGIAFPSNNADSTAAMASVQQSMSQMQQAMQQTFRQAQQNFAQAQNQMNAQSQSLVNTQDNTTQQSQETESSIQQMQESFQHAQQQAFMQQQQEQQTHQNFLPNDFLLQNKQKSSQGGQSNLYDQEQQQQRNINTSSNNGNISDGQNYQQQMVFQGDQSQNKFFAA